MTKETIWTINQWALLRSIFSYQRVKVEIGYQEGGFNLFANLNVACPGDLG